MHNVALVVPSLHQGGGVRAVARFVCDAVARRDGWAVTPISLCMAADDVESTSIRKPATWFRDVAVGRRDWSGTTVPHVGARFGELEFQRYRPRRALRELIDGCDVVQVVCGSPAWANAVVGLGKPVALQVATLAHVERGRRDAQPRRLADWWRKGMTSITRRLDDQALRRVDAIQVENPWMLEYARKVNRRRNADVRYAPPGIDATHFRPLPGVDRCAQPYILCVGRLADPRKNAGLLLAAYARLSEMVRARVPLVLAGSSAPPAAFWERAESLGLRDRIRFHDRPDTAALLSLYQHATAFALPSDEEGLGIVLLEAMACGVPVVATRCGGPDGIVTDGEDGYLVPRNDAEAMADRLLGLLQSPVRNVAVGQAARHTVERRYDERLAGEVFIDMWGRLLHGAGAQSCAG